MVGLWNISLCFYYIVGEMRRLESSSNWLLNLRTCKNTITFIWINQLYTLDNAKLNYFMDWYFKFIDTFLISYLTEVCSMTYKIVLGIYDKLWKPINLFWCSVMFYRRKQSFLNGNKLCKFQYRVLDFIWIWG